MQLWEAVGDLRSVSQADSVTSVPSVSQSAQRAKQFTLTSPPLLHSHFHSLAPSYGRSSAEHGLNQESSGPLHPYSFCVQAACNV